MSGITTILYWTGAGYYGGLQVDGQEGAEVRVYRGAPGTRPFYRHKPGSTLYQLAAKLQSLTYEYQVVRGEYEGQFAKSHILPTLKRNGYSVVWDSPSQIKIWSRVRVEEFVIPPEWKHLLSLGIVIGGFVYSLKVQVPVCEANWSAVVKAATAARLAEKAYEEAQLNEEFIKEDETHETIVLE